MTINPTSGKSTVVDFGKISYSHSDAGKTYEYRITESGDVKSVKNAASRIIRVTVDDNGNGSLEVTPDYGTEGMTFTNTYDASGTLDLKGTKTIKNRKFKSGDSWTFTVTADDENAPMPTNKVITINPTDADGKEYDLEFGTIPYGLKDINKTYVYTITETGTVDGVTNDSDTHTVTVTISDNGDGTLKVDADYSDATLLSKKVKFTNTYNRKGEYNLVAKKTIEGRNFKFGDTWTFKVETSEGAPLPKKLEETIRPISGTSADIDFGKIEFTEEHVGKEFTYTISEVKGNVDGINYDENSYSVIVKVDTDADGKLLITPTYVDEEKKLTFTNKYSADGEATLAGKKVIQGREFKDGDEWTFTVTGEDKDGNAAPLPYPASVTINPQSGTTAPIDFGTIKYSEKDIDKTYVYTITESGIVDGVVNDTKVHTATVKVKDNDDGTLKVTVKYSDGKDGFVFTNTYSVSTPTPTPSEEPTATPSTTPSATETPGPSETPGTTPEATATPETTPEASATPGTTPEATATPAATPETTPGQTPGPDATPTPEVVPTPDNTPNPVVTPGNNPTPTPPHGTVLGARKVRMGGKQAAVLGARRGADFAVLGKRRRPSTGDSMSLLIWIITMSVAMGGAITSSTLLSLENGRKRRRRR